MLGIKLNENKNMGLVKIFESHDKQCRLINGFFKKGEGIEPHIHPFGEDCALVISGELTYFLSNENTILVSSGEVVFGFVNVLHGYLNQQLDPVHLVIFATPQNTGLSYLADTDPLVVHPPLEKRIMNCLTNGHQNNSDHSSFTSLVIEGTFQEKKEEGFCKVFIDWVGKEVFIFDNENVMLEMPKKTIILRYKARS